MAKKKLHDTREHAVFSPSSAHRWLNCPASISMSKGMPDIDSEAAKEGTRAHEYLEKILDQEYFPESEEDERLLKHIPEEDRYMAPHLYEACKYIEDVIGMHKEGCTTQGEHKVSLVHLGGDCWGHLDYAIWSEETGVEVIDFKFGRHPVEIEDNRQLESYLIALCDREGWNFPEYRTTIIQPRAPHIKGSVRSTTYTKEELHELREDIREGIARCLVDEPAIAAGDWCQYCKGSPRCPEIRNRAQELARSEFSAFNPVPVEKVSDEQLAAVILHMSAFRDWLERAEAEALRRQLEGVALPGLKVVYKVGRPKLKDSEYDAWAERTLEEDDRYRVQPHTITELRAILKNYDYEEDVLSEIITTPEPSLVAVPDTDGRIEYIPAAVEFKNT